MMSLATLTSVALLLAVVFASAQQNTMTAGRPSAVLNDAQCQEVWTKAVPKRDTLAQADAAPYIVNFAQVDADNDGTIDKKEFEAACAGLEEIIYPRTSGTPFLAVAWSQSQV